MDASTIKAIAINWLDDGVNAVAMRKWVEILRSHTQWERDMHSQGKNPNRLAANRLYFAKREAMSQIIDIYLTGWLDSKGLPIDYRSRQDIFSMAHQLLTGKEPMPDKD